MANNKGRGGRRKLIRPRLELCLACLDRDALALDGRPREVDGAKLSWGCEICHGVGEGVTYERMGDWPRGDRWHLVSKVAA